MDLSLGIAPYSHAVSQASKDALATMCATNSKTEKGKGTDRLRCRCRNMTHTAKRRYTDAQTKIKIQTHMLSTRLAIEIHSDASYELSMQAMPT